MSIARIATALALAVFALTPLPAAAQTDAAAGWVLISVAGVAAEPGGRIAFAADGAVFGTTGCNRFSGQVVSAPGVLSFNTPLASTKMACPGPLMVQEMQLLEALHGSVAVAYDPVADRMTLIPTSGAAVLGFARAE